MRIQVFRHRSALRTRPAVSWRLLFFMLLFCVGAAIGAAAARRAIVGSEPELIHYLQTYLHISRAEQMQGSFFPALVSYCRYPVLAFLLGFSSAGILLLPLLSLCQGFFLSYAVFCFSAVLGQEQFLLILAAFFLRCLLMLPCTFVLLLGAWDAAKALAAFSFGGGKRQAPVRYDRRYYLCFGICVLVLLLGVFLELTLVPRLLQAAADVMI